MIQHHKQENLLLSVSNAIRILRSFTMDEPQKGVRELARELHIGKSSVQRIFTTLAAHGFVRKNKETNKYELGISVLQLSSIFLSQIVLHQEALPIVTKLAHQHRETSHLAILENLKVVYLCKVETHQSMELVTHTGFHVDTHCTSSGKLLLAYSEPSVIDLFLHQSLMKFTPTTIIEPNEIRKEMEKIRKQGYSMSRGELRKEVSSVSAPIRDHTGKVIAAINIVGPTKRFTLSRIQYLAQELKRTSESISERLGYRKY